MAEYRAYVFKDGRISKYIDLICEDDNAANDQARPLVDGQDVELWAGQRFVTRWDHKLHQLK
jgi:hypothetical protein